MWKLKILTCLNVTWIIAGLIAGFLFEEIGEKICYVAGGIAIACGLYGMLYLEREKRLVAAEEAREKAEAEKKKAEAAAMKANPFLKAGSLDKLRMITKVRPASVAVRGCRARIHVCAMQLT